MNNYTKDEIEFINYWLSPKDIKKYETNAIYRPSSKVKITPLEAATLQKKAFEKLRKHVSINRDQSN